MTITITYGWWLIPCVITVVSIALAVRHVLVAESYDIAPIVSAFAAVTASLASWLIWSLLT
jgi:hypothetical protein